MSQNPDVDRLAANCAALLQDTVPADPDLLEPHFRALLTAIRDTDPRFAFDRDGRPSAIAAVRGALPALERELLDAIIEDHACELAAVHEAWLQVASAGARRS